jgi:methylphosphotriester-DNA--protein-cysteine methyltransferase
VGATARRLPVFPGSLGFPPVRSGAGPAAAGAPKRTRPGRAHFGRRTFVRSFRAATGTTPAAWIRARRPDAARRLLETTDLSIDQISADCGFGNAVTLRQNFAAAFSATPTEYRRRFDARVP